MLLLYNKKLTNQVGREQPSKPVPGQYLCIFLAGRMLILHIAVIGFYPFICPLVLGWLILLHVLPAVIIYFSFCV